MNDIYNPWEVTIDDWREEARRCGLDPMRVEEIVVEVATALTRVDYSSLPCGPRIGDEIRTLMGECTRDLMPSTGIRT